MCLFLREAARKTIIMKGISFLFVIGSYGGFFVTYKSSSFHICLGFLAMTIFFYDVENAMNNMMQESKEAYQKGFDDGYSEAATDILSSL